MAQPPPFPWPVRALFAAAVALGGVGLAEGVVRLLDHNAFTQIGVFELRNGEVRLAPAASVRLRRADGRVYTLHTGHDGDRLPAGERGLLVGDSQALGFGVADEDTFAARLGLENAGVPGHGVGDALAHARELLAERPWPRVVVVLNQANDWEEGMVPARERYVIAGGWLGSPERAGTYEARFWASPLSRVHVFAYGTMIVAGHRPSARAALDPQAAAARTAAFAAGLRSLQEDFPAVEVVALFLPADAATSEARAARSPLGMPGEPWKDRSLVAGVRAALAGFPLVDLSDRLGDPADFLTGDYHLSEAGHAVVAGALGRP